MTTLKAIETRYAGCYFRSRLEARWAVFFDALNIDWRYEYEGYELDGTRYLPDFWLPELVCWYEIKGRPPTEDELQKARDLSQCTNQRVYIAWGDLPWQLDYHGPVNTTNTGIELIQWVDELEDISEDSSYAWCVCPCGCGRYGIEYEGRGARIHRELGGRGHTADHESIQLAYEKARSFRFDGR